MPTYSDPKIEAAYQAWLANGGKNPHSTPTRPEMSRSLQAPTPMQANTAGLGTGGNLGGPIPTGPTNPRLQPQVLDSLTSAGRIGAGMTGAELGGAYGAPMGPMGALAGATLGGAGAYASYDALSDMLKQGAQEKTAERLQKAVTDSMSDRIAGAAFDKVAMGAAKALDWAGEKLLSRGLALKPGVSVNENKEILGIAKKQGQVATRAQVAANKAQLDDYALSIRNMADAETKKGVKLDLGSKVADELRGLSEKYRAIYKTTPIKELSDSADELAATAKNFDFDKAGIHGLTPTQVLESRQAIDQMLENYWRKSSNVNKTASDATDKAYKTIANIYRHELADKMPPAFSETMKKYSDLIKVSPFVEEGATKSMTHFPMFLALGATGGGALSGHPLSGAATGAALYAVTNPGLQSKIANRGLYPLSQLAEKLRTPGSPGLAGRRSTEIVGSPSGPIKQVANADAPVGPFSHPIGPVIRGIVEEARKKKKENKK